MRYETVARFVRPHADRGGRFVELKRPWLKEPLGPTIMVSPEGPDVYHDDWTRVGPRRAAKPGEMLIARAIGLGATEPPVPADKPFPADPYAKVLARIEVRVNGERAESGLLFAWPNEVGTYRVDFRVPKGTARGVARVEISADGTHRTHNESARSTDSANSRIRDSQP